MRRTYIQDPRFNCVFGDKLEDSHNFLLTHLQEFDISMSRKTGCDLLTLWARSIACASIALCHHGSHWIMSISTHFFAARVLQLTKKTLDAAVKLSPTAPLFNEINITVGASSSSSPLTGSWKALITSVLCFPGIRPSNLTNLTPSCSSRTPTQSKKDVNWEKTRVLSSRGKMRRYLTSSSIFAELMERACEEGWYKLSSEGRRRMDPWAMGWRSIGQRP